MNVPLRWHPLGAPASCRQDAGAPRAVWALPEIALAAAILALWLCCAGSAFAESNWPLLRKDGLHDPKGPAIKQLQEPRDSLSKLPPDNTGNMVHWIKALQSGAIKPRASLKPDVQANVLDLDILLNLNGSMPIIRFPHKQHTEWLDCANCHDGIFKKKTGTSQISMTQILAGEQCGICHGAVAFPLTECSRCHSVLRPGQTKPVVSPGIPPSHKPPGPN